jgi:hypothetical protein
MMMFSKKRSKLAEVLIPAMFVAMSGDVFAAATSAELAQAKTNAKSIVSTQNQLAAGYKTDSKSAAASVKKSAIDNANENIALIDAAIKQINSDAATQAATLKSSVNTQVKSALSTLKTNFNSQKSQLKSLKSAGTLSSADYKTAMSDIKAAYNSQVSTIKTGQKDALKAISTALKESKKVTATLKSAGVAGQRTDKIVGKIEANNLLKIQQIAIKSAQMDAKQAAVLLYNSVKTGTVTVDGATEAAQTAVDTVNADLISLYGTEGSVTADKTAYVDTVNTFVDESTLTAIDSATLTMAALNDSALTVVYALIGNPVTALKVVPEYTTSIIQSQVDASTAITEAVSTATDLAAITDGVTAAEETATAAVQETTTAATEANTANQQEATAAAEVLQSAQQTLVDAQKNAQKNDPVVSPSA